MCDGSQIEENFTDYKVAEGSEKSDVVEWEHMNENISKGDSGDLVLDARPSGRYFTLSSFLHRSAFAELASFP